MVRLSTEEVSKQSLQAQSSLRADAPVFEDDGKSALDSPSKAIVLDLSSALPDTGFNPHADVAPFLPTDAHGPTLFDHQVAALESIHSFGLMSDDSSVAGFSLEAGFYSAQLEYVPWYDGEACLVTPWSAGDATSMSAPSSWPCMDPAIDMMGSTISFGESQMPWTTDQQSWDSTFVDLSGDEPAAPREAAARSAAADWVSARAELAKQRAPGFRLEGLESLEDSLRKLTLDDLRGLGQAEDHTRSTSSGDSMPETLALPSSEAASEEQGPWHKTAV